MSKQHGLSRRSILIIVLIYGGILFSFCLLFIYGPRHYIHGNLNTLTASLKEYPLPPNTRVIGLYNQISENTGNGDYCHYLVRLTLTSSISKKEILSYYENAVVPGINEFGYTRKFFVKIPDNQRESESLEFTIEVSDMTERYFDFGCK